MLHGNYNCYGIARGKNICDSLATEKNRLETKGFFAKDTFCYKYATETFYNGFCNHINMKIFCNGLILQRGDFATGLSGRKIITELIWKTFII